MKKKSICFIILCLMFLFGCSSSVKETDIDYFTYEIVEKTGSITITGYNGPDEDVIIPAQIDNRPVTIIGEEAFCENSVIKNIVVPEGVVEIERAAFSRSTIKNINLPNTLETIGYAAFHSTEMDKIEIPKSVKNIKSYNFDNEITILYVEENSYALEYAVKNNFTYILNGKQYDRLSKLEQTLQDITEKMNEKKYDEIIDILKNKPSVLNETIYYFQNGKVVNKLSNGEAIILMENGIYSGEVKNQQRSGKGIQLGIYTDDYSYTVADGTWKNDKLNGNATYYEYNISVSSSKSEPYVDFIYNGNFTNNYYDGNIKATWKSSTGTYSGTFKADMGNIAILREEDGKYIYLDNGNGYYWYFIDQTALNGWMVWDGRNTK